jgi:proteasome assembly chaperone (PAC2) family protein
MSLYELQSTGRFTAPVVIAAFDGWIDAAGAATAVTSHIARDSEVVAVFDNDALIDHRARRPVLDIVDGTLSDLSWPQVTLRRARFEGRDVLVLTGPEPDFKWNQLGDEISELALQFGVVEWISLGAIPAAVPHTRDVPVLATASKPELLRSGETKGPQGLLRVPAAALSVLEMAVSGSGIPTIGYYAQVPHYVAGPYAAATIALLEYISRHLGITLGTDDLAEQAREQKTRLDGLVEGQPDAKAYLEQLEGLPHTERIPSGDEIASEIERFLRESGSEGGNPFDDR